MNINAPHFRLLKTIDLRRCEGCWQTSRDFNKNAPTPFVLSLYHDDKRRRRVFCVACAHRTNRAAKQTSGSIVLWRATVLFRGWG